MYNLAIAPDNGAIVIPKHKAAATFDEDAKDDVKAAHLSSVLIMSPVLQSSFKELAPVDGPAQIPVLIGPIRLRQGRHQQRIPFWLRYPLIASLGDRPRPRA